MQKSTITILGSHLPIRKKTRPMSAIAAILILTLFFGSMIEGSGGANRAYAQSITALSSERTLTIAGLFNELPGFLPPQTTTNTDTSHAAYQPGNNDNNNSNGDAITTASQSSDIESTIHNLVNQAREQNNLHPLSYDDKLASVALEHSQDMAKRNYFSHYTPDGNGPTERAVAAGYGDCRKDHGSYYTYGIGENIYKEWGSLGSNSDIAHATFNAWMNSPGHRANILDSNYDGEGIGATIVGNTVYVTEDFC
jgi:uncharacterized protein YkwD